MNKHNIWESTILDYSESVGDNVHSHGLSFPDNNTTYFLIMHIIIINCNKQVLNK